MKQHYEKKDRRQEITDMAVSYIETHQCLPYQKEWDPSKCDGQMRPFNPVTGTIFRGINQFILGMSLEAFATGDSRFITFAQAKSKGWSVKKGAKSLPVIYYEPLTYKNDDGEAEDVPDDRPSGRMMRCILKGYNLFHASMIEGIPAYDPPRREAVTWTVPRGIEAILKNSGVVIVEGGDQAFYSPATQHIALPPKHAFNGETDEIKAANHSASAVHELGHWAEDVPRLNLVTRSKFGAPEYARGELRAELAAIFVCAEYNLPTKFANHASYLESWLKALKNDKNEIFRAAAGAQKIADYLTSFDPDHTPNAQPEEAPKPLDHLLPASALPRPAARTEQPAI